MDHHQPDDSAKTALALLVRADASVKIGSGHVMRCLALAQAWLAAGGTVTFLSVLPPTLRERLEAEGMAVLPMGAEPGTAEDAHQTIAVAQAQAAGYIVVDGYVFGADYQRQIKEAGLRLLFLDDNSHAAHYYADLVLNQNIHASDALYPHREPYTQLLLGTHYALLRREFWAWRNWQRTIPAVAHHILVTMGGSDPDNVTLKVVEALALVPVQDLEIKMVLGSNNPHVTPLKDAAQASPHNVELAQNVADMPALMAWADVAISAAGSTCWELAFMGLPAVLIVLAENQTALAEGMDTAGAAINLGWHSELSAARLGETLQALLGDADRRAGMQCQGQELVGSLGGERVARALQSPFLRLRLASEGDCALVFQWANEPGVREASFSQDAIPWETHVEWFHNQIHNRQRLFFIAEDQSGTPTGQVRFTLDGREATISTSLDRHSRGYGRGSALITLASEHVSKNFGVILIHAYIKPGNAASQRAFARAGYVLQPQVIVQGQPAIHMTWGNL